MKKQPMSPPSPVRYPRLLTIDFDQALRTWDGFGFNYVEASQTRDYDEQSQDYGGFSQLEETRRQEILSLVFGKDGLQPGLLKMFLDPFHQPAPVGKPDEGASDPDLQQGFDHQKTTQWIRYFARKGHELLRSQGLPLQIVTTLYSPPAWMTQQGFVRGRDLRPDCYEALIRYLVSWASFLRTEDQLPVRYLSLHNEGEDWIRWPADAKDAGSPRHDYNLYWPPEQVTAILALGSRQLRKWGLDDLQLTCGETTHWSRFYHWGYAQAIAGNEDALNALGLITSHGFLDTTPGNWYGDWRSLGSDLLRSSRPDLHAWTTSTSWRKMDVSFAWEIQQSIYTAKLNGWIPWAGIQQAAGWEGGDPNPGTAIRTFPDGTYAIEKGYYWYKLFCQAGRPGMSVCPAFMNESDVGALAFGSNHTAFPNAFIMINQRDDAKDYEVRLKGHSSSRFKAYITSDSGDDFKCLGHYDFDQSRYVMPPKSATLFIEEKP